MNTIDEIKKLKALFDQGAITEEEFNMLKKNVLLNNNEPTDSVNNPISSTNDQEKNKRLTNTLNLPLDKPTQKVAAIRLFAKRILIGAIILGIVWLIGNVFFSSSSYTSSSSISSPYEDNSIQQQTEKKKACKYCKGTGIKVCNLCGGTGVNNMGIECGCIRTYNMELAAGHTPSHEPLRWTCTFCGGTGESKY